MYDTLESVEEYMTVKDVAKRLGISDRGVRKLIERDRLKAHKVGGEGRGGIWLIPRREFERLKEEREA